MLQVRVLSGVPPFYSSGFLHLITGPLGILVIVLGMIVFFYAWVICLRLLGYVYYVNRHKLVWLGEHRGINF